MTGNPFTTSFGKEPRNFISRYEEENTIINSFTDEMPSQQVYMITGVRGSGKTALLTRVKKRLASERDWIIVELGAERELLNDLIAKLCDEPSLRKPIVDAQLNLSLFGISLGLKNSQPVNSAATALARILDTVKKQNKRLLITIDEASNSKSMRAFASEFQILLREDYPIFLIMTGLYKNIYDLQNEETLTFLYRAPKIALGRLNNTAVINSYKSIFGVSTEDAAIMAERVKGYAFAYQLYGSLKFEAFPDTSDDAVLGKYEEMLGELVYEKLWSELSIKDKEIMTAAASIGEAPIRTGELIAQYNKQYPEKTAMNDKLMSVYRERLKREGLIDSPKYGYIQIALPGFSKYINEYGAII